MQPLPVLTGLSACCRGNTASSGRLCCHPPLCPGFDRRAPNPALGVHVCSLPRSCAGHFGGASPKCSVLFSSLTLPWPHGRCLCPVGFEGLSCHTTSDPCKEHSCENGGSCVPSATNYTCLCPAHYTGTWNVG